MVQPCPLEDKQSTKTKTKNQDRSTGEKGLKVRECSIVLFCPAELLEGRCQLGQGSYHLAVTPDAPMIKVDKGNAEAPFGKMALAISLRPSPLIYSCWIMNPRKVTEVA